MKFLIIKILIVVLFFSCKEKPKKEEVDTVALRETLIRANQLMTQKEAEEIKSYLEKNNIPVEKTASGLRYKITEDGNNNLPEDKDTVTVIYSMNLLNGDSITGNEKDTLRFILGRAELPRGMEEGLSMIGEGGQILMIIPSHLAYGRRGNESNIPGSTALIVNAELLTVKKAQTNN